ncbi:hypothetical protein ACJMK2_027242 [Sinanodonta woodiana]|uniref:VLIG-type G domain-containing protein n=1 Tax=Sinanodonta woodiana TaxID=1069815 RepID=A0ABD3XMB9_SINWO
MANSNVEIPSDGLFRLLKHLNLTEKYPGRLTREDMYQISEFSLFNKLPKCKEDLASYFLHKIARYDYTAREFCILNEDKKSSMLQSSHTSNYRKAIKARAESKRELDISPLDIIIAVFLCCDDISRQDLASHMWSCRLAIPFVIQENEPSIPPICFLWPLRNIIMKWEKHYNGNFTVREGRLVKESFTSIAFLRVGELRLSKSALINSVMSTTEKTHSIFFHRDCPGSTKQRYLVDGLIDISWYIPTPKLEGNITDHFEDPVTFLNLHGDNYQFNNYLPLLSKIANIIVVMSQVKDINRCRNIIKPCIDLGKAVLVILTDQTIQPSDEDIIDNFTNNLKPSENQLEYLEVVGKQRAELVKETRFVLMNLVKSKQICLETAFSDTGISVDENVDEFCTTKKAAQKIYKLLRSTEPKERKHSFFPLQDEPWINWAAADKERLRTTYKKKNKAYHNYKLQREMVMKHSRDKQLDILKKGKNQELIDIYLNSISTSNSKERKLFLRWLKFEIDDLSREELCQVYQEYHEIMECRTELTEAEKETSNSRLKELDNEIAARSFGLEHIMREIGQIYEALQVEESPPLYINHDLPELAAKILLDGYPLELLDGYVNAVPIQWVINMLRKLDKMLEEKLKRSARIKVITVLGIQSSGKSTMLNALFGCQFAVSAGRCTRGVYCQIIKIEEAYSEKLEIDYVLAIDTEGLRAPELSAIGQMVKHDNELSTFVIGLGDLTILSLIGENATYLDDLLPITVLAFLRMKITTQFRPTCITVHQNVNKKEKQNLLHQGRILEETLNKMTHIACNVERIEPKSFKEIIAFDVGKDVWYLPALLEESKPMAPISTKYSEELNVLKQTLVAKTSINTMGTFIQRLQSIWTAIKKDDFAYQFRNAIETEARSKLDNYWCDANWNFRQPVHTTMSNGYIKIQNTLNPHDLERVVQALKIDLRKEIEDQHSRQKDSYSTFISQTDTVMKETMMQWSVDMNKRFDDLKSELLRETSDKLGEYKQDRKRKFFVNKHKLLYKATMKTNIEHLATTVKLSKQESLKQQEIEELFEDHWKQWKSEISGESPICPTFIDIENDAYNALTIAFPSEKDTLNRYIDKKQHLSMYDFDDFQVQKLLKNLPVWEDTIFFNDYTDITKLQTTLFSKVKDKLDSREAICQPYSKEDIDEVVQVVKDHFQDSRKDIQLKLKHEVYLAVLVCGHAIKRLQTLHEKYESENSLENMLEKEKKYCFRVFKALYYETETVELLVTECREILRNGILSNMTQTLPDMIEIDIRRIPLTSKSLAIKDLMIKLATKDSFEMFQCFILDPHKSITQYIHEYIDRYVSEPTNPLRVNFEKKLETIKGEVGHALHNSFAMGRSDFQTWLSIFHNEMKDRIVIENIDRLDELGNRSFDLDGFFQKLSQCLTTVINEIKNEMTSYLDQNVTSMKEVVMERIFNNVIGCTEGCPFCGALCLVAHRNHTEQHSTTFHRPEGCIGRYYRTTKILAVTTCPEAISKNSRFEYLENGVHKWCNYRDYTNVYPRWKITRDATGEDTSYWKCYFAKYADKIAGNDKIVPDIPEAWKLLEWKTEIQKLQNE